ncbi:MAG: glucosamine 6-phosphate synthetase [bacterium]
MCGLSGIIWRKSSKRRVKDVKTLTDIFTRLLVLSEHRGPHATGVAWVKRDGSMAVAKAPLPASKFVETIAYRDCLAGVNAHTTILMGHTRWPTRGSEHNPANNHPLIGEVIISHNGHISNADALFRRHNLPRAAQVDSEILLRLAEKHTSPAGIDVPSYLRSLEGCTGRIAAVLVATARPEQILLLRGNMPLIVWYHSGLQALAYASEEAILQSAVGDPAPWLPLPLAPGEALLVDTSSWAMERVPFSFPGMGQSVGWQRYTGT